MTLRDQLQQTLGAAYIIERELGASANALRDVQRIDSAIGRAPHPIHRAIQHLQHALENGADPSEAARAVEAEIASGSLMSLQDIDRP